MTNVEFETDKEVTPSRFAPQQQNQFGQEKYGGGLTNWLINKGIIKDESQAKTVLLGILVFNLLLTSFILYLFIL